MVRGPAHRGTEGSHPLPQPATQPSLQPLTQAAVGPKEPSRAEAGPGGRITGAPVETPAWLLTAGSKPPRGAPCEDRGRCQGPGAGPGPRQCAALPRTARRAARRTHAAGSRSRGSQRHTCRSPGRGGRSGSRWDNGTSAHSAPQRCLAGRLGRRRRSVPARLGSPLRPPQSHPPAEPPTPWGCRSRGTHSPVPARAGSPTLLAARPREACWTATLPGDVVAGGAWWALAVLATVLSEPATRAGCRKPCAGVAGSPGAGAGRAGGWGGARRQGPPPPEQRGPRVRRRQGSHRSHTASPSIPGGRGRPP